MVVLKAAFSTFGGGSALISRSGGALGIFVSALVGALIFVSVGRVGIVSVGFRSASFAASGCSIQHIIQLRLRIRNLSNEGLHFIHSIHILFLGLNAINIGLSHHFNCIRCKFLGVHQLAAQSFNGGFETLQLR